MSPSIIDRKIYRATRRALKLAKRRANRARRNGQFAGRTS